MVDNSLQGNINLESQRDEEAKNDHGFQPQQPTAQQQVNTLDEPVMDTIVSDAALTLTEAGPHAHLAKAAHRDQPILEGRHRAEAKGDPQLGPLGTVLLLPDPRIVGLSRLTSEAC